MEDDAQKRGGAPGERGSADRGSARTCGPAGRRPEGRAVLSPQDRLRRRGRDPRTGHRAELVGVYLVVGLDRRNMLLIALARIGEDAADIRRASGPPRARYNVNVQCRSFVRSPPARRQHLRREPKREMGQRGNATMLERAIGEATARRVKSCGILAARGRRNGPLRARVKSTHCGQRPAQFARAGGHRWLKPGNGSQS